MQGSRRILAVLCLAGAAGTVPAAIAAAQQATHEGGHVAGTHPSPMHAAMERMQEGMKVPPSGSADVDFARMMIAHHQGAIDMARLELQDGKDPELRRLAEEIIAVQEKEIAFLQAWLDKRGE